MVKMKKRIVFRNETKKRTKQKPRHTNTKKQYGGTGETKKGVLDLFLNHTKIFEDVKEVNPINNSNYPQINKIMKSFKSLARQVNGIRTTLISDYNEIREDNTELSPSQIKEYKEFEKKYNFLDKFYKTFIENNPLNVIEDYEIELQKDRRNWQKFFFDATFLDRTQRSRSEINEGKELREEYKKKVTPYIDFLNALEDSLPDTLLKKFDPFRTSKRIVLDYISMQRDSSKNESIQEGKYDTVGKLSTIFNNLKNKLLLETAQDVAVQLFKKTKHERLKTIEYNETNNKDILEMIYDTEDFTGFIMQIQFFFEKVEREGIRTQLGVIASQRGGNVMRRTLNRMTVKSFNAYKDTKKALIDTKNALTVTFTWSNVKTFFFINTILSLKLIGGLVAVPLVLTAILSGTGLLVVSNTIGVGIGVAVSPILLLGFAAVKAYENIDLRKNITTFFKNIPNNLFDIYEYLRLKEDIGIQLFGKKVYHTLLKNTEKYVIMQKNMRLFVKMTYREYGQNQEMDANRINHIKTFPDMVATFIKMTKLLSALPSLKEEEKEQKKESSWKFVGGFFSSITKLEKQINNQIDHITYNINPRSTSSGFSKTKQIDYWLNDFTTKYEANNKVFEDLEIQAKQLQNELMLKRAKLQAEKLLPKTKEEMGNINEELKTLSSPEEDKIKTTNETLLTSAQTSAADLLENPQEKNVIEEAYKMAAKLLIKPPLKELLEELKKISTSTEVLSVKKKTATDYIDVIKTEFNITIPQSNQYETLIEKVFNSNSQSGGGIQENIKKIPKSVTKGLKTMGRKAGLDTMGRQAKKALGRVKQKIPYKEWNDDFGKRIQYNLFVNMKKYTDFVHDHKGRIDDSNVEQITEHIQMFPALYDKIADLEKARDKLIESRNMVDSLERYTPIWRTKRKKVIDEANSFMQYILNNVAPQGMDSIEPKTTFLTCNDKNDDCYDKRLERFDKLLDDFLNETRDKKNTKETTNEKNTSDAIETNETNTVDQKEKLQDKLSNQPESFQKLLKKLQTIHKKNATTETTSLKKRKMGIYNDIADLYVSAVCQTREGEGEGEGEGDGEKDKQVCEASNDPENTDIKMDTMRKEKIFALIKALEHPKFVSYIQTQDQLVSIQLDEAAAEKEKTETETGTGTDKKKKKKQKPVKLKLDETRRLVVSILRKYNSENFIDFDEMLYRFFPRTFDADFRGFSPMPDRIEKQTNITMKGYRSELDENEKQKFGRLVPSIDVTYPNGFMEQMLGSMLEVENFITASSNTGDKTRDKDIDKPLFKEEMVVKENQYYPGVNKGLGGEEEEEEEEEEGEEEET